MKVVDECDVQPGPKIFLEDTDVEMLTLISNDKCDNKNCVGDSKKLQGFDVIEVATMCISIVVVAANIIALEDTDRSDRLEKHSGEH